MHDDIFSKVVKTVINKIDPQLVKIFYKSLLCGIFPNELKVAKDYPVYQCDDEITISIYRLISVLPVFSKILEEICLSEFQNC